MSNQGLMSNDWNVLSVVTIVCACGESFENEELFNEHSVQCRNSEEEEVCTEVEYKCSLCHSVYATNELLEAHIQKVHVNVNNEPGTVSRNRGHPKSRVCDVCGKTCSSAAALTYHMRVHTGEKPYKCPYCPKRFTMHILKTTHIRTHTGERPYDCNQCTKAFSNKAALNRHMRVHTGAKPYACPECGKCFSQSNSTKLHYKTVHLKEPTPYKKKPKLKRETTNYDYDLVFEEHNVVVEPTNAETVPRTVDVKPTIVAVPKRVVVKPVNSVSVPRTVTGVARSVPIKRASVASVSKAPENVTTVYKANVFNELQKKFELKGKKITLIRVKSEPVDKNRVE